MDMNDDFDIREAWAQLEKRVACLESAGGNTLSLENLSRRKTALQRLSLRYLRFSRMSVGFMVLPVIYIFDKAIEPLSLRLSLSIFMILFFALASVMDYMLYRKINEIQVDRMSVTEVVRASMLCRKYHHRCIMVLMPMALIFVVTLVWIFSDNIYIMAGIATGFIFGLAIGLRKYLDFMYDYRIIKQSLPRE